MKRFKHLSLLAGVVFLALAVMPAQAARLTPQEIAEHSFQRRAVEVANWAMPLVNTYAMREALRRDAGVGYNEVAYHSRVQNWKLQFTTNNGDVPYGHIHWTVNGQGVILFGTLMDAWQRPLEDVGNEGADRGNGGKYLIVPANYQGEIPAGHVVLRQTTHDGYTLLRFIPPRINDESLKNIESLVKQIGVYPYAQAVQPPATRHVDVYDRLIDGVPRLDDSYFDSLHAMIQQEPIEARDMVMMGMLRTLGIVKGAPFSPTPVQRKALAAAAAEADAFMFNTVLNSPRFYGAESGWMQLVPRSAIQSGFSWDMPNYTDLDGRAGAYRIAYTSIKRSGRASYYLANGTDSQGQRLAGGASYSFKVPANVPVNDFWSVTAYDDETAAWFKGVTRGKLGSLDEGLQRNADGSVDIHFGPVAPTGRESNWIPTLAGKTYFLLFRFYGPKAAVFERSFRLNDMMRQE
jgi:hypothetical protein